MIEDRFDCQDLIRILDRHVGENQDIVSLAIETDLDEAFFVATPMALMRLASALLKAAATAEEVQTVAGVECKWSTFTHEAADKLAHVVVGAECVVRTDHERELVVSYFRQQAGGQDASCCAPDQGRRPVAE